MKKIFFFPNGNTAVFIDGNQVPDLQESWFALYLQAIISIGYDPMEFEITMPDGSKANVSMTDEGGINWTIN